MIILLQKTEIKGKIKEILTLYFILLKKLFLQSQIFTKNLKIRILKKTRI